jgi:hypothetical protein
MTPITRALYDPTMAGRGAIVRLGSVGLLGVVAACSTLSGLTGGDDVPPPTAVPDAGNDAAPGDDAGADTVAPPPPATTCRWDAPFTAIHEVTDLDVSGKDTAAASFTPDELVVYFQTRVVFGGPFDLFRATRPTRSAPFGEATPIDTLDSPAVEQNPAIAPDERAIVFGSDRADAGLIELFLATRATTADTFGAPTALAGAVGIASPTNTPFFTADRKELWFTQTLGTTQTTYVSPVLDAGIGPASVRNDVSGWCPVLTSDKLTLYTASGTSSSTNEIRVAHRAGPLDAFGPPAIVTELVAGGETPSWISPDSCRLYFTTRRNTVAQIYVAERFP